MTERVSELLLIVGHVLIIGSVVGLMLTATYYVIVAIAAPIRAKAKTRIFERPVWNAVDLTDESIPEGVHQQLVAHHEALVALGFQPRGLIHKPAARRAAAYVALFWHPGMATRALFQLSLGPKANTVRSSLLPFEIKYADGTSVELSNSSSVAPRIERVPGLVRQMPQVSDVPRLFAYFIKLVAKYERDAGLSARERVPLADDATVASVFLEELRQSLAIMYRAGLWTASAHPGVWRPTWRGALLLAGRSISPGSEFFRRRLRVRGDRLQRELDGDATRTRFERIGPRAGWTMFVAGLVFIAAAMVMSPAAALIASMGMSIGWSLGKRGRNEPRSRSLVIGGTAAVVLVGVPLGLQLRDWPRIPLLPMANILFESGFSLELWLLPMGVVIAGATLMVEGFRAAAT